MANTIRDAFPVLGYMDNPKFTGLGLGKKVLDPLLKLIEDDINAPINSIHNKPKWKVKNISHSGSLDGNNTLEFWLSAVVTFELA